MSKWSHFVDWVNGDYQPKEYALFSMATRPKRGRRSEEEEAAQDRHHLTRFFRFYPIAAALITLCLVGVLLVTALTLPPFGAADNPTNNAVAEHYLEMTEEETGATNAVTGLILNYRGFDTFGESCVLFLAVNCVIILLRRDDDAPIRLRRKPAECMEPPTDLVLQQTARYLIPMVALFGIYVLLNGHSSPGGGFSGGTILAGGLILCSTAFGPGALRVYLDYDIYNVIRVVGLGVYGLLYAFYIFVGANGLGDHITTDHGGMIAPIEIAVGIVVACTIYGFYALFSQGEI